MLALAVGLYLAAVLATAVAAVVSAWRPPLPRWGVAAWLLLIVECGYIVQAPACVYLPRVPGKATQRVLLGVDAAHKVHWAEGTSPVAFLWGPRWWLLAGHTLDGGVEFVPPVRYALLYPSRTQWEIVSESGRWPHPLGSPRLHELMRTDGSTLAWGKELLKLAPGESAWRELAALPWPNDGPGLEAVALTEGDGVVELYQDWQTFHRNLPRGTQRDITLLQRDSLGREVVRASVSLPTAESDRSMRHHLDVAASRDGFLVFELWWDGKGKGTTYLVEPGGRVTQVNSFDAALQDGYPVNVSASRDGAYFSTGQAVFRMTGEKVVDIQPMLSGCRWDGRTLYGARRYPFFVSRSLARQYTLTLLLATARQGIPHPDPGFGQRVRPYKEGWEKGHWVFGGLDEAGREDEIVRMEFP